MSSRLTDCPYLKRDIRGTTRHQYVQAANRQCDHPDHRFIDAQHVPVEEEMARLGLTPEVAEHLGGRE